MLNTNKTNDNYFDDDVQSQYQSTKAGTLIGRQRRGTRVIVVLFILHLASSMSRVVCLEGATDDFQNLIIIILLLQ